MPKDKYSAIWLSHSSIRDFLNCPKVYYLRNIYKNPKTGKKIAIIKPALALGQVVHNVIDDLSILPIEQRLKAPLIKRFEEKWTSITGKKGGFMNGKQEAEFKERGLLMIKRLAAHPGLLLKKAIKLKEDLPYFWLSEEENFILCGKIDWLEYDTKTDSIHIVDFKTGKVDEKDDSLQLPIYYLVAKNSQSREISGASYWYLDKSNKPVSIPLPNERIARDKIMEIASRIKLARQLSHFKCLSGTDKGCIHCAPLDAIKSGRGEFVGLGNFGEEIYILPYKAASLEN